MRFHATKVNMRSQSVARRPTHTAVQQNCKHCAEDKARDKNNLEDFEDGFCILLSSKLRVIRAKISTKNCFQMRCLDPVRACLQTSNNPSFPATIITPLPKSNRTLVARPLVLTEHYLDHAVTIDSEFERTCKGKCKQRTTRSQFWSYRCTVPNMT